jgi:hypothetical protein
VAGGINPNASVCAGPSESRQSLFFDPPKTGKTAVAELLAEVPEHKLIARQASDLISPDVGETKQNQAHPFRDCEPARSIHFLHEIDSLPGKCRRVHHAWEHARVNKLLQHIKCVSGSMSAAYTCGRVGKAGGVFATVGGGGVPV